ncbi:hypothetical protein DSO57_1018953 [Entomophthora muscae]|nr:hypothetical protein DSO57_1018953 [Entomophthora muscae]
MASPDAVEECLHLIGQTFTDPHLVIPIRGILLKIRNTALLNPFWTQLPHEIAAVLRCCNPSIANTLVRVLAALGHVIARHPSSVIFYEAALDAAQFLHAANVKVPLIPTLLNACYDQLKLNHMA